MFFKPGHHGSHRNKLGQHADTGADRQSQRESDDDRHMQSQNEPGPEHAAKHADLPRGEAHDARGGEHDVVGHRDQRVNCTDGKARPKN